MRRSRLLRAGGTVLELLGWCVSWVSCVLYYVVYFIGHRLYTVNTRASANCRDSRRKAQLVISTVFLDLGGTKVPGGERGPGFRSGHRTPAECFSGLSCPWMRQQP